MGSHGQTTNKPLPITILLQFEPPFSFPLLQPLPFWPLLPFVCITPLYSGWMGFLKTAWKVLRNNGSSVTATHPQVTTYLPYYLGSIFHSSSHPMPLANSSAVSSGLTPEYRVVSIPGEMQVGVLPLFLLFLKF
ncbi:uncharacterized protein BO88DRAFT_23957 [Aspergillus vadensis CBS 113365]|uniref:Uncharacterized protein n=1 Tax=Aspergillus vadensis (strain CBS 113365 / IMI 142717 / IBT 24658) TaxID=1448311 RepID=A0A319CHP2_ASPVC|nr:hypothetical protein BO88DRAFT_23957 [Aspergillus vadensis CBS 113365]PYH74838.1 hypothetical protein BO88DRAFT_23957 [Aspergillus vadensis CBS 113365]